MSLIAGEPECQRQHRLEPVLNDSVVYSVSVGGWHFSSEQAVVSTVWSVSTTAVNTLRCPFVSEDLLYSDGVVYPVVLHQALCVSLGNAGGLVMPK